MRRLGWVMIGLLLVGCGGGTGVPLPTSQAALSASSAPIPNATATRAPDSAAASTAAPVRTAGAAPSPTVARTATPAQTEPAASAVPSALRLVASGYGQAGLQVGVGFVVENTDGGRPIGSSQYQIAAYDAGGVVLATDSNFIEVMLPGQTLGFGSTLFLKSDAKVAKVDVQLKAGKVVDGNTVPPAFTTEKATLKPDKSFPKVSGIVRSVHSADLKVVQASSIVYDSAGKIIGAGYTFVDLVPASGQAAVDMSVIYAGTPAKVELYAAITSLSGA